jgi:hypothetical protein
LVGQVGSIGFADAASLLRQAFLKKTGLDLSKPYIAFRCSAQSNDQHDADHASAVRFLERTCSGTEPA